MPKENCIICGRQSVYDNGLEDIQTSLSREFGLCIQHNTQKYRKMAMNWAEIDLARQKVEIDRIKSESQK
jgi:hypothetical protein